MKKTKTWLLSAVMTAGIAAFAPSAVRAADRDRDREEWVKYEDVPRAVKETLDRERGRREIKRIDHVVRDGKEYYRATIDTKGGEDTVLRVAPGGKILSVEEIPDRDERRGGAAAAARDEERPVKYANLPDRVKETFDRERGNRDLKGVYLVNRGGRTYYQAIIDERNGDRVVRVGENGRLLSEEDIREVRTAGSVRRGVDDDGDRVAFEHLPGEVKAALGREAGADRVGEVYRYQRRGQTIYEADVNSGTRSRVIRVNENGRILSETDETPEGRRSVRFNDLPGEVKAAFGRDANPDQINRVVQLTQNGRTYYRAQVNPGRGRDPYWITVDENGRTVRDFDRDTNRR